MEFYNRVNESKAIVNCILPQGRQNKILLVAGVSGVGKSGLVKKLLNNELGHQISIRVCVSKSSVDTIENLHYINALYKAFYERAKEKHFDKVPTPQQQGLLSPKRLFNFGKGLLWAKAGIGEENRLFEPIEEGNIIRKKDYIIALLQKMQYIVAVENIQNVDTQSLEILNDILKRVEGTTFIWEYTISEHHSIERFVNFYNELSAFNAEVSTFRVDELDFSEAKKLAPSGISEAQLKNIYDHSEGNLVKLILSRSFFGENDNPIQVTLDSLEKDEYFLINILYLNSGTMPYAQLCRAVTGAVNAPPLSPPAIMKLLSQLADKKVIVNEMDGTIRILHDSILAELENQPVNPILYAAYSVLKNYYLGELNQCPNEQCVEQLFCIYLKFSDEELLNILPHIKKIIESRKYPQDILAKLSHYKEKLLRKGNVNYHCLYEITLIMIQICIKIGYKDEAQSNLDLIYTSSNPYHRALQAAIFSLNGANKENLAVLEQLVNSAGSQRERFTIQLCLMSVKMEANTSIETILYAKTLLEKSENEHFFEYAFLLRNYAELVDDFKKCVSLYTQALQIFKTAGRDDLRAQVLVSLSMMYAYRGELSISRKLLVKARNLGGVREGFLLNNSAVLDILADKIGDDTLKQLNDALLIIGDVYERLIIACNLLVCYVKTGKPELAAQICATIESGDYECYQYEEFLHIIYQNLWYYHNSAGNLSAALFYSGKIRALIAKDGTRLFTKQLATLQLAKEHCETVYYSSFPFRVDFLGDWGFEISRDLENSQ